MKKQNHKKIENWIFVLSIYMILAFSACTTQRINYKREIKFATHQQKLLINNIEKLEDTSKMVSPRSVDKGKITMGVPHDWTSGFFPGILWYLYQLTNDKILLGSAIKYTNKLSEEQFDTKTHDLGFIVNNSFGNAYQLLGTASQKSVIINAAKSLSTRFNSKVGLIKSWDHAKEKWTYPVIIDNMMNLQLLFNATKLSGDSSFYKIAVSHADYTLKNHFRPNNSSYHVVDYDPANGKVIKKMTAQGYSNESSWARGEAWALYGFLNCYEETRDARYLARAVATQNYIFSHPNLPEDLIPYWDFDDPSIPNAPKDASAAAVISSALFRMAKLTGDLTYKAKANKILYNLSKNYRSSRNENFGFILMHSVGHKSANSEVDVPIIYADYYYVEALLRSQE